MIPESFPENLIDADDIIDVALHLEVKCRAYELYEHDTVGGCELKDELRRVAYAVAQIQKNSNGEGGDTRAVRAARVYLRALCSFVGDDEIETGRRSEEPHR